MAKRSGKGGSAFIKKGREVVEEATSGNNGQTFLKIGDGESFEIVPIGGIEEIISFDQHAFWLDEGNSPIFPCLQTKDCPGCMLNNDPRFKAIMPVMIKTDAGQEERLVVLGKQAMKQLSEAEEAVGASLHGHILRYSRKGNGMNTKYSMMPTGRTAKVPPIEEFSLQPIDHIGPTDRDEQIKMLREAKLWKKTEKSAPLPSSDWDEDEFVNVEDEEMEE